MEEILSGLAGKKIDVNCGSNVMYSGQVVTSTGGILKLENEDGEDIFIAIDKIAAFSERKDHLSRPGFIA
ncbi:MAG: hypothetical protein HOP17_08320 [Acidobacteria bacterium]|nr:hypothetical protein [Acidobacteriota bacterium]